MITRFLFIISCFSLINSESYPTILLHGIASSKEALYELEDSMNNYNIKTNKLNKDLLVENQYLIKESKELSLILGVIVNKTKDK